MSKRRQVKKGFFLNLTITFFLAALTQIGDARKAYLKFDEDFKFSMILFVIFLCLGFLSLGFYVGINYYERQIDKK
jgi:hypothetical protein